MGQRTFIDIPEVESLDDAKEMYLKAKQEVQIMTAAKGLKLPERYMERAIASAVIESILLNNRGVDSQIEEILAVIPELSKLSIFN